MRWMTYSTADDVRRRTGVVHEGEVFASARSTSLLELLGADGGLEAAAEDALARPRERIEASEAIVDAPIPTPPSFRDFMAFEDHIVPILRARGATLDPAWYEIPGFYFTNPAAVQGPTQPVHAAPEAVELDYELEVAAVLGRSGRDLSPQDAAGIIAGFVLLADWSARDLQRRERGIGLGPVKGKDWASSFGPVLVTADEFAGRLTGQGFDLPLTASVNGTAYSSGNLADLYWSFGQMISYASRGTEVRVGDVIGSGTVPTGCIADLRARHGAEAYPWLTPSDQVRLDGGPLGSIDVRILPARRIVPLR